MKVVITGVTGFICSHLAQHLLNSDVETTAIVRPQSDLSDLAQYATLNTVTYDGKINELKQFFAEYKPDLVIHLASCFIAEHQSEQIEQLIQSNLVFATELLEAGVHAGVRKFINTGTSWQHYQNSNYNPVCLYAATKQAFEQVIDYYVQAHGLQALTLKLFDTYGPNDKRKKLFYLLQQASESQAKLAMSPGEQLLDLVYISDVVDAYMQAITLVQSNDVVHHQRYAVSCEKPIALRELVSMYEQINRVSLNIEWGGRVYRQREVMQPWTAGAILPGWKPKISIEQGIATLNELAS